MQTANLTLNKTKSFYLLFIKHIEANFLTYIFFFLAFFLFKQNYSIGINNDHSLPNKIYLIHYGEKTGPNDIVVFKHFTKLLNKDVTLTKIYTGQPGDKITIKDSDVFVGSTYVGHTKPKTRLGKTLTPIQETIIPSGKFFARATHKDSFDSRYQEFGLVDESSIIGKARAIF